MIDRLLDAGIVGCSTVAWTCLYWLLLLPHLPAP